MFTGLIHGVGRIDRVEPITADGGVRITVDASRVAGFQARVGDSIALNGACMTATTVDGTRFSCDVSAESLACTSGLNALGDVNIEASLKMGDAIGGHIVAGHVDGIGTVRRYAPVGESWELVILAPAALARFLAVKGSVAVNGVSLTVNRATDPLTDAISINIIPHTHSMTTLGQLAPGDGVNLEVDLIARYVEACCRRPSRMDRVAGWFLALAIGASLISSRGATRPTQSLPGVLLLYVIALAMATWLIAAPWRPLVGDRGRRGGW
jgi:riboflavin synthase